MTLSILCGIIYHHKELPALEFFLAACFIQVSVIYTGAMLERKTWIFHQELIRMLLLAAFAYYRYPSTVLLIGLLLVFSPRLFFFRLLNHQYTRLLFG